MPKKRRSTPGPYIRYVEMVPDRISDATQYPFTLPALRGLNRLELHPRVTFLIGENGSGKSTLLEAIAVQSGLNPEGGSRNFNFSTQDTHSVLCDAIRLVRTAGQTADSYFLRAESFYNVATEADRLGVQQAYGNMSLHHQSHGESFFTLFSQRFGPHGLYLLDEPEAALSPRRQLQFLGLLHGLLEQGGQFIIATHSPIIMAYPQAQIYLLDEQGIRPVAYRDTDHYQITRGFLSNPESMLRVILDELETLSEED